MSDIEHLLDRFMRWVEQRPDIRALALVGSFARGDETPGSDIDLVVLTTKPDDYTSQEAWIAELDAELMATRNWGAITERRLKSPEGLKLDIGIGEPSWASTTPVDPGTRKVVSDGIRILYDPDDLLRKLTESAAS